MTGPNSEVASSSSPLVPGSPSSSSAVDPSGLVVGDAEAEDDEPAANAADAGIDARAPAPEEVAPPEPPLVACAAGETLGPRGTCYFAVSQSLPWASARRNCTNRGAGWDLASIRSDADNRLVGELITEEAWVGASDAAAEGTWLWVIDQTAFWLGNGLTGRPLGGAFQTWNPDEPNGGATSDCARAVPALPPRASGPTWADFECEELLASLCEGPPL
jgi:hypothetical protein